GVAGVRRKFTFPQPASCAIYCDRRFSASRIAKRRKERVVRFRTDQIQRAIASPGESDCTSVREANTVSTSARAVDRAAFSSERKQPIGAHTSRSGVL